MTFEQIFGKHGKAILTYKTNHRSYPAFRVCNTYWIIFRIHLTLTLEVR